MDQLSKSNEGEMNPAHAEKTGDLITFDLQALTHFQESRPYSQVLSDIGTARLVLFAFRSGQHLKEHHTSSQIIVYVVEGRVDFTTATNSIELHAGMVVQLEASIAHSVLAKTDAVVLLTLTLSPVQRRAHEELPRNQVPLVKRIGK